MKKIILLAALTVTGVVSAKNAKSVEKSAGFTSEISNESKLEKEKEAAKLKVYYNPIRLKSSCGYIEWITLAPGESPACLMVELAQMEDFCNATVDGEWLV